MVRSSCAAAAAVGLLSAIPAAQVPATLLTVAQRDRLRSTSTPSPASISDDGRYVAFSSYERLVPEDSDGMADIYLLDRVSRRTTLISVEVEGRAIASDCALPRISGDGRFVTFETATAVDDGSTIARHVVVRDLAGGGTRRVSRPASGATPDGPSSDAAPSHDAGTIVFASTATNIVPGQDANGLFSDIYARDRASGETRRISVDPLGVQVSTGSSVGPTISGDGRYVAFASTAPLLPGASRQQRSRNGPGLRAFSVYLRDLIAGTASLVAPRDRAPDGPSWSPVISRDGRFVAFVSLATNLVNNDRNGCPDVFLYDRSTGGVTLVSRGPGGRTANGTSERPAISADGRFVAFQSDASDLTCAGPCGPDLEDINLLTDVFLFDRLAGTVARLSGGGEAAWMEASAAPALDGAGRVVAFTSRHPIDSADVDEDFDLFVRASSP